MQQLLLDFGHLCKTFIWADKFIKDKLMHVLRNNNEIQNEKWFCTLFITVSATAFWVHLIFLIFAQYWELSGGEPELQNDNLFSQIIWIWVKNFTPKTRNSRLICFCDKMRKPWSIQVVVGLVCYVRRPIEYLQQIWVRWKHAWVKNTPIK